MKYLPVCLIILAGCQSAPAPTPPPPAPVPSAPFIAPPPNPGVDWERRLRQQRAIAEALVSQNDTLAARVRELEQAAVSPPPNAPAVAQTPAAAPTPAAPSPDEPPALSPNADGVIDLTALAANDSAAAVNPFVLRQNATAAAGEITLTVQGIVRGERTTALVNNRLVAAGDPVEGLQLKRIEADALVFDCNNHLLRVPLNGRPVRIRRS